MIVVFRDLPFGGFDIIETVSIHTTHRNLCSTYAFFSQTRCNILYDSLLATVIVVALVRRRCQTYTNPLYNPSLQI